MLNAEHVLTREASMRHVWPSASGSTASLEAILSAYLFPLGEVSPHPRRPRGQWLCPPEGDTLLRPFPRCGFSEWHVLCVLGHPGTLFCKYLPDPSPLPSWALSAG